MEKSDSHFIFIDYENVQPKRFPFLKNMCHDCYIFVFVGSKQKINHGSKMFNFVKKFGKNGKIILFDKKGKNALDFYLMFYIGKISENHPQGHFYLLSKDKGYDPAISFLSKDIDIHRYRTLFEIPEFPFLEVKDKNASSLISERDINVVITKLKKRNKASPKKVNGLINTIKSIFKGDISFCEVEAIFDELKRRGIVIIDNDSVSYFFDHVDIDE